MKGFGYFRRCVCVAWGNAWQISGHTLGSLGFATLIAILATFFTWKSGGELDTQSLVVGAASFVIVLTLSFGGFLFAAPFQVFADAERDLNARHQNELVTLKSFLNDVQVQLEACAADRDRLAQIVRSEAPTVGEVWSRLYRLREQGKKLRISDLNEMGWWMSNAGKVVRELLQPQLADDLEQRLKDHTISMKQPGNYKGINEYLFESVRIYVTFLGELQGKLTQEWVNPNLLIDRTNSTLFILEQSQEPELLPGIASPAHPPAMTTSSIFK